MPTICAEAWGEVPAVEQRSALPSPPAKWFAKSLGEQSDRVRQKVLSSEVVRQEGLEV